MLITRASRRNIRKVEQGEGVLSIFKVVCGRCCLFYVVRLMCCSLCEIMSKVEGRYVGNL